MSLDDLAKFAPVYIRDLRMMRDETPIPGFHRYQTMDREDERGPWYAFAEDDDVFRARIVGKSSAKGEG